MGSYSNTPCHLDRGLVDGEIHDTAATAVLWNGIEIEEFWGIFTVHIETDSFWGLNMRHYVDFDIFAFAIYL